MELKFNEKFTIEVPQEGKDNYVIEGKLLKDTPKLKKAIEKKYKKRDDEARKNQKIQNVIRRNQQKAQNIADRIALIDDKKEKAELLKEQQALLDEAYKLSDEFVEKIEKAEDTDILEIVAKEHIDSRVIIKDEDKAMFESICNDYGYQLIWNTILQDIEEGKQKDKRS